MQVRSEARLVPLVVLALVLGLAACGGPSRQAEVRVRSFSSVVVESVYGVAAVEASVGYDSARHVFVGVNALEASVLAVAFDDGAGSVRIGLISAVPVSGALVELVFGVAGSAEGIALESFAGFDVDARPVVSAGGLAVMSDGVTADRVAYDVDAVARDLDGALQASGVRVLGFGRR